MCSKGSRQNGFVSLGKRFALIVLVRGYGQYTSVTAFGQIVFIVEVCQQWWTEAVSTHGREPLRRPSERVLKSLRGSNIYCLRTD
jgi:hypothetical protein